MQQMTRYTATSGDLLETMFTVNIHKELVWILKIMGAVFQREGVFSKNCHGNLKWAWL